MSTGILMKQTITFKVKAVLENVPLATECVTQSAQTIGLDDETLYQIQLAVDEACANVVHHAYKGMEPGDLEISCDLDDQTFVIRVRDWGRGFDPNGVAEPNVDAPLEKRTLGGLGLFLIKQFMDEVQYTCDPEQGNELTAIKRLQVAEE